MYILGARALGVVSLLFPCCLASSKWNSILTSTHNLRQKDKLEGQHRHHNHVASSIATNSFFSKGSLGFREKEILIGKGSRKRGWSKTVGVQRRLAMRGGCGFRGHPNTLRCACALPPAGISSLAWDLGMGVVSAAASVLWVKLWTGLARAEKLSPQVSRKIIHATAAPLFMVMWPFFTSRPSARFFAAGVPLLQMMRLTAAGLSGDKTKEDESSNELVTGISRSGRASEILEGPLKYALVLTVLTVSGWRSSIVSTVALMQMAVGDGMSDLIGRRFGSHKWRPGGKKSIEGSAAFASGAFAVSMSMIAWYHRAGVLLISPAESVTRVAGVSIACATVELLPKSIVGDDNISVPAAACLIGRLLFGSPAGGGGGV